MCIRDRSVSTGDATNGASGSVAVSSGDAVGGAGGDISVLIGTGDTGHGGNISLSAGDTSDANHRGGFLSLFAGGNSNTAGGRGGVVKMTGGVAGGKQDCDLQDYECAGLSISVEMHDAVLHGCTGNHTGVTTYVCHNIDVTEEQYDAVLSGCTQKCLGGAVEITGGLSSGGCLLYTSPSPRDATLSRMPSSA